MLRDWILPSLWMALKFLMAVAVLTVVWFASAQYHARFYDERTDARIRVRVNPECVRPDFVQTMEAAREYDLTMQEISVIRAQTELVNRRMGYLLDEADRIEDLRESLARGKVKRSPGGVGGPAPNPKRKE